MRPVTPPFAFSPDETLLAVPAGDNNIAVIGPSTFGTKALLPTPSRVMQLAFLRDGTNWLVSWTAMFCALGTGVAVFFSRRPVDAGLSG